MKIAVIQASSQKEKNEILYECTKNAVRKLEHEVVNFGIFPEETCEYSYIHTALHISALLESKAVDFAVTGCSSGQGMMLACNSLPGILCGYTPSAADAFLFGRINNGNAVSVPLGLNFGWAGEINLQSTLDNLFRDAFGTGYPKKDAKRKQEDSKRLKALNAAVKRSFCEMYTRADQSLLQNVWQRKNVLHYVLEYGKENEIKTYLGKFI